MDKINISQKLKAIIANTPINSLRNNNCMHPINLSLYLRPEDKVLILINTSVWFLRTPTKPKNQTMEKL